HEARDAIEILDCLRRGFDGGAGAPVQGRMNLVRALGPDTSAAALGQFLEVGAALLDRLPDGLVLEEQALQRLSSRGAADVLVYRDFDVASGLQIQGHFSISGGKIERGSIAIGPDSARTHGRVAGVDKSSAGWP